MAVSPLPSSLLSLLCSFHLVSHAVPPHSCFYANRFCFLPPGLFLFHFSVLPLLLPYFSPFTSFLAPFSPSFFVSVTFPPSTSFILPLFLPLHLFKSICLFVSLSPPALTECLLPTDPAQMEWEASCHYQRPSLSGFGTTIASPGHILSPPRETA